MNLPGFCPHLPSFAILHYPAETSKFDLFAQLPKKGLDFALLCHYNLARFLNKFALLTSRAFARIIPGWARGPGTKTARLRKNFALTRKKDLTLVAFARILAQVTPIESKLHFRTGAPAPKIAIGQALECPGVFHVEHHASRSHRVASRFLMPRFLLA